MSQTLVDCYRAEIAELRAALAHERSVTEQMSELSARMRETIAAQAARIAELEAQCLTS